MEKNISDYVKEESSKKTIKLDNVKVKLQSKFFFMMIISIVALIIASIEFVLLSLDFSYILIEFVLVAVLFVVALIYSCIFSKYKTKWNLFSLVLVVVWMVSFVYIGISGLQMWGGSFDTTTRVKLIFPCVYQYTRYSVENQALGKVIKSTTAIYFNWIVSFGLSVMFVILHFKDIRQKKRAD